MAEAAYVDSRGRPRVFHAGDHVKLGLWLAESYPDGALADVGSVHVWGVLEACKGAHCDKLMVMVRTKRKDGTLGKPTPIDFPPGDHPAGHLVVIGHDGSLPVVRAATADEKANPYLRRWTGHFGTCADAEQFRRR